MTSRHFSSDEIIGIRANGGVKSSSISGFPSPGPSGWNLSLYEPQTLSTICESICSVKSIRSL